MVIVDKLILLFRDKSDDVWYVEDDPWEIFPTELDDEEEDMIVVLTLLLLLLFVEFDVSLNTMGATKLNPRNRSWLVLLNGRPGESKHKN